VKTTDQASKLLPTAGSYSCPAETPIALADIKKQTLDNRAHHIVGSYDFMIGWKMVQTREVRYEKSSNGMNTGVQDVEYNLVPFVSRSRVDGEADLEVAAVLNPGSIPLHKYSYTEHSFVDREFSDNHTYDRQLNEYVSDNLLKRYSPEQIALYAAQHPIVGYCVSEKGGLALVDRKTGEVLNTIDMEAFDQFDADLAAKHSEAEEPADEVSAPVKKAAPVAKKPVQGTAKPKPKATGAKKPVAKKK
jgi:hypothetical protein